MDIPKKNVDNASVNYTYSYEAVIRNLGQQI